MIIARALIGPVALSLWGAIYLGYRHAPFLAVIVWAAICMIYLLWWSRDSFRHMFALRPEASIWFNGSLALAISLVVGAAFLGGNALVYFLVGRISH